jgi:hypothetical protein
MKGLIGRRWSMRERRPVNWRPRSNIGRGAKSKHFERLARRLRTVAFSIALQRGLVIANWHNVV